MEWKTLACNPFQYTTQPWKIPYHPELAKTTPLQPSKPHLFQHPESQTQNSKHSKKKKQQFHEMI